MEDRIYVIMFNSITSIYIGYIQYIPIIGMVYTESASLNNWL